MSNYGISAASQVVASDDNETPSTELRCEHDAGGFVLVSDAAAAALYRQFQILRAEPVFVDIFKPITYHTATQFVESFSAATRPLWVMGGVEAPTAYFCLHSQLRQHDLANLDFGYFTGCPDPGSEEAVRFWRYVRERAAERNVTRIQSFVVAGSMEKICLLESLGFHQEGLLREHYFHNGRLHDLVVHAWMAEGRHD